MLQTGISSHTTTFFIQCLNNGKKHNVVHSYTGSKPNTKFIDRQTAVDFMNSQIEKFPEFQFRFVKKIKWIEIGSWQKKHCYNVN